MAWVPCPRCHGQKGIVCPKCEGQRSFDCHCENGYIGVMTPQGGGIVLHGKCDGTGSYPCGTCDAHGIVRCPTCRGLGSVDDAAPTSTGFWAWIRELFGG